MSKLEKSSLKTDSAVTMSDVTYTTCTTPTSISTTLHDMCEQEKTLLKTQDKKTINPGSLSKDDNFCPKNKFLDELQNFKVSWENIGKNQLQFNPKKRTDRPNTKLRLKDTKKSVSKVDLQCIPKENTADKIATKFRSKSSDIQKENTNKIEPPNITSKSVEKTRLNNPKQQIKKNENNRLYPFVNHFTTSVPNSYLNKRLGMAKKAKQSKLGLMKSKSYDNFKVDNTISNSVHEEKIPEKAANVDLGIELCRLQKDKLVSQIVDQFKQLEENARRANMSNGKEQVLNITGVSIASKRSLFENYENLQAKNREQTRSRSRYRCNSLSKSSSPIIRTAFKDFQNIDDQQNRGECAKNPTVKLKTKCKTSNISQENKNELQYPVLEWRNSSPVRLKKLFSENTTSPERCKINDLDRNCSSAKISHEIALCLGHDAQNTTQSSKSNSEISKSMLKENNKQAENKPVFSSNSFSCKDLAPGEYPCDYQSKASKTLVSNILNCENFISINNDFEQFQNECETDFLQGDEMVLNGDSTGNRNENKSIHRENSDECLSSYRWSNNEVTFTKYKQMDQGVADNLEYKGRRKLDHTTETEQNVDLEQLEFHHESKSNTSKDLSDNDVFTKNESQLEVGLYLDEKGKTCSKEGKENDSLSRNESTLLEQDEDAVMLLKYQESPFSGNIIDILKSCTQVLVKPIFEEPYVAEDLSKLQLLKEILVGISKRCDDLFKADIQDFVSVYSLEKQIQKFLSKQFRNIETYKHIKKNLNSITSTVEVVLKKFEDNSEKCLDLGVVQQNNSEMVPKNKGLIKLSKTEVIENKQGKQIWKVSNKALLEITEIILDVIEDTEDDYEEKDFGTFSLTTPGITLKIQTEMSEEQKQKVVYRENELDEGSEKTLENGIDEIIAGCLDTVFTTSKCKSLDSKVTATPDLNELSQENTPSDLMKFSDKTNKENTQDDNLKEKEENLTKESNETECNENQNDLSQCKHSKCEIKSGNTQDSRSNKIDNFNLNEESCESGNEEIELHFETLENNLLNTDEDQAIAEKNEKEIKNSIEGSMEDKQKEKIIESDSNITTTLVMSDDFGQTSIAKSEDFEDVSISEVEENRNENNLEPGHMIKDRNNNGLASSSLTSKPDITICGNHFQLGSNPEVWKERMQQEISKMEADGKASWSKTSLSESYSSTRAVELQRDRGRLVLNDITGDVDLSQNACSTTSISKTDKPEPIIIRDRSSANLKKLMKTERNNNNNENDDFKESSESIKTSRKNTNGSQRDNGAVHNDFEDNSQPTKKSNVGNGNHENQANDDLNENNASKNKDKDNESDVKEPNPKPEPGLLRYGLETVFNKAMHFLAGDKIDSDAVNIASLPNIFTEEDVGFRYPIKKSVRTDEVSEKQHKNESTQSIVLNRDPHIKEVEQKKKFKKFRKKEENVDMSTPYNTTGHTGDRDIVFNDEFQTETNNTQLRKIKNDFIKQQSTSISEPEMKWSASEKLVTRPTEKNVFLDSKPSTNEQDDEFGFPEALVEPVVHNRSENPNNQEVNVSKRKDNEKTNDKYSYTKNNPHIDKKNIENTVPAKIANSQKEIYTKINRENNGYSLKNSESPEKNQFSPERKQDNSVKNVVSPLGFKKEKLFTESINYDRYNPDKYTESTTKDKLNARMKNNFKDPFYYEGPTSNSKISESSTLDQKKNISTVNENVNIQTETHSKRKKQIETSQKKLIPVYASKLRSPPQQSKSNVRFRHMEILPDFEIQGETKEQTNEQTKQKSIEITKESPKDTGQNKTSTRFVQKDNDRKYEHYSKSLQSKQQNKLSPTYVSVKQEADNTNRKKNKEKPDKKVENPPANNSKPNDLEKTKIEKETKRSCAEKKLKNAQKLMAESKQRLPQTQRFSFVKKQERVPEISRQLMIERPSENVLVNTIITRPNPQNVKGNRDFDILSLSGKMNINRALNRSEGKRRLVILPDFVTAQQSDDGNLVLTPAKKLNVIDSSGCTEGLDITTVKSVEGIEKVDVPAPLLGAPAKTAKQLITQTGSYFQTFKNFFQASSPVVDKGLIQTNYKDQAGFQSKKDCKNCSMNNNGNCNYNNNNLVKCVQDTVGQIKPKPSTSDFGISSESNVVLTDNTNNNSHPAGKEDFSEIEDATLVEIRDIPMESKFWKRVTRHDPTISTNIVEGEGDGSDELPGIQENCKRPVHFGDVDRIVEFSAQADLKEAEMMKEAESQSESEVPKNAKIILATDRNAAKSGLRIKHFKPCEKPTAPLDVPWRQFDVTTQCHQDLISSCRIVQTGVASVDAQGPICRLDYKLRKTKAKNSITHTCDSSHKLKEDSPYSVPKSDNNFEQQVYWNDIDVVEEVQTSDSLMSTLPIKKRQDDDGYQKPFISPWNRYDISRECTKVARPPSGHEKPVDFYCQVQSLDINSAASVQDGESLTHMPPFQPFDESQAMESTVEDLSDHTLTQYDKQYSSGKQYSQVVYEEQKQQPSNFATARPKSYADYTDIKPKHDHEEGSFPMGTALRAKESMSYKTAPSLYGMEDRRPSAISFMEIVEGEDNADEYFVSQLGVQFSHQDEWGMQGRTMSFRKTKKSVSDRDYNDFSSIADIPGSMRIIGPYIDQPANLRQQNLEQLEQDYSKRKERRKNFNKKTGKDKGGKEEEEEDDDDDDGDDDDDEDGVEFDLDEDDKPKHLPYRRKRRRNKGPSESTQTLSHLDPQYREVSRQYSFDKGKKFY